MTNPTVYTRLAEAYDITAELLKQDFQWMTSYVTQISTKRTNILLVGPKGNGKSSLLSLLYNAARNTKPYIDKAHAKALHADHNSPQGLLPQRERTVTRDLRRTRILESICVFDCFGFEFGVVQSDDDLAKKRWKIGREYLQYALKGELVLKREFKFLSSPNPKLKWFHNGDIGARDSNNQIDCVVIVVDITNSIDDEYEEQLTHITDIVSKTAKYMHTTIPVVFYFNKLDVLLGIDALNKMTVEDLERYVPKADPLVPGSNIGDFMKRIANKHMIVTNWCPSRPEKDEPPGEIHWDTFAKPDNFPITKNGVIALRMLDRISGITRK